MLNVPFNSSPVQSLSSLKKSFSMTHRMMNGNADIWSSENYFWFSWWWYHNFPSTHPTLLLNRIGLKGLSFLSWTRMILSSNGPKYLWTWDWARSRIISKRYLILYFLFCFHSKTKYAHLQFVDDWVDDISSWLGSQAVYEEPEVQTDSDFHIQVNK